MSDASDIPSAEEIEDGTYYLEARRWYSDLFHVPIAERCYYVLIIILALINAYYAVTSFMSVFPIATRVPFVIYSQDVFQELPRIQRITAFKGEDGNIAVMRYLLKNYVSDRESYDLTKYELRYRSIWHQSEPAVFEQYKTLMDTSNPYSPYRLYTNRARAVVTFDKNDPGAFRYEKAADGFTAHIVYTLTATTLDGQEFSHGKYRADIAYKYTPYVVDQSLTRDVWVARFLHLTGNTLRDSREKPKVTAMTFKVSDYQVKELLE